MDCLSLEFPRRKRATEDEKGVARAGLTEGPFILRREPIAEARDEYREKGTSLTKLCSVWNDLVTTKKES